MTGQYSADLWPPRNTGERVADTLGQLRFSSVATWRKAYRRSIRSRGEALGRRSFLALLAIFPFLFVGGNEHLKAGPGLSGKRAMFVTRIRGS